MRGIEKQEIINKPTVAYYSGLSGLEIKEIQYGIEDYIVYVTGSWCGNYTVHRTKIYTTNAGKFYFKCYGYRIPLDECIRM